MNSHEPTVQACSICLNYATKTPDDREYIRCTKCGVLRTRYNYDPEIYGASYARTYNSYAKTDINTPLNLFRVGLVSRWLKEGQAILDIGCCVGEFIRFAEQYYRCVGYEPNIRAAAFAVRKCDSPIATELDGNIPRVNCITMFDVIEHVEQPQMFLQTLQERFLVKGGIIALTTPNVEVIEVWNDTDLRKWKHYKPKEHLFLHTEQSLTVLCEKTGLEPIYWGREESDIRPGNPNGDILTCVARKL